MKPSTAKKQCVRSGCQLVATYPRLMLCDSHYADHQRAAVKAKDTDQIVMELTSHPCQECGKDRGSRPKFCSTPCRLRAADKRKRQTKPCLRCGEPKEFGRQGARYCDTCREVMGPVWAELERERGKQRQAAKPNKRPPKVADDGRIWCSNCSKYLKKGAFNKFKDKPPSRCRACAREYHHEYMLKQKYGIDSDEYHRISAITDHRCSICRNRPKTKRLAVDHDHKTGAIRGLLCKRCNRDLLGAARDSIEMLERAISYLESPPAQTGLPVLINEDFVGPQPGNRE